MDISLEVVNFPQELKRIEEEMLEIANEELIDRVGYAVDQLKIVTPVDTGEARSKWSYSKELELDGSTSASITNTAEHIIPLNNGHSRQAPAFFIEQILSRIGLLQ